MPTGYVLSKQGPNALVDDFWAEEKIRNEKIYNLFSNESIDWDGFDFPYLANSPRVEYIPARIDFNDILFQYKNLFPDSIQILLQDNIKNDFEKNKTSESKRPNEDYLVFHLGELGPERRQTAPVCEMIKKSGRDFMTAKEMLYFSLSFHLHNKSVLGNGNITVSSTEIQNSIPKGRDKNNIKNLGFIIEPNEVVIYKDLDKMNRESLVVSTTPITSGEFIPSTRGVRQVQIIKRKNSR